MIQLTERGLSFNGPLTINTARETLETGLNLLDGRDDILADLAAITEVDSSALTVLLELFRQAKKRGKTMRFANFPANLSSLAALYDITDVLPN